MLCGPFERRNDQLALVNEMLAARDAFGVAGEFRLLAFFFPVFELFSGSRQSG